MFYYHSQVMIVERSISYLVVVRF